MREYRDQNGDIPLGRASDSHIVIDDPGISCRHCFIIQVGDELFLADRGGKHMTLVNGIQVIWAKVYRGDSMRTGVHHTRKVSILTKDSSGTVSAAHDGMKKLMTTSSAVK